jgi:colanic acid biosynthesis glycosyl transferase WcaI
MNFAPELTGIGRYNGEMAAWLAERGYDVKVICAPPYYPGWRVPPEYRHPGYRVEQVGNVSITRCPVYIPRKPTGVRRILHLLSFAVLAAPVVLWQAVRWRPDSILVTEPPLSAAPVVLVAARLCGARAWLHIQDLEIDAAYDLGMVRGRRCRAFLNRVESALMRGFDHVSTISGRMLERVLAKGVCSERATLFPNWTDFSAIFPIVRPSSYRDELKIPNGACVLLYSGTLGVKQGIDLLVEAFVSLPPGLAAVLVICGDGPCRESLDCQVATNDLIRLLPLQPTERLNDLMALADIQLLPQRAEAQDLVMPSKLPTMLASGRAVLACAAPGSEIAAVLDGVAVLTPPGDPVRLASAMVALIADPDRRSKLGALGRARAKRFWERDAVLTKAFRPGQESQPDQI